MLAHAAKVVEEHEIDCNELKATLTSNGLFETSMPTVPAESRPDIESIELIEMLHKK